MFVVGLKQILGNLAHHRYGGQGLLLHRPRLSLLQAIEQAAHELVDVGLQCVPVELLSETDERIGSVRGHPDVDVVEASHDGSEQQLVVAVLHVGLLVIRHLPNGLEGGEAHPRVDVRQPLCDEVDALVDPGLVFDVLHHLRHRHDGRARVLPRDVWGAHEDADRFEEHWQEDVLALLHVGGLLGQAVEVFFPQLDGVAIYFVVLFGCVSLRRPGVDVLLHVEHPLDVQSNDLLQERLALWLAEVLEVASDDRHGRLHGAVPDVVVGEVPGGAQLHQ
mmetsp:Transcript_57802/g.150278  ORF Transcript_57802/g.150278 Transcript_57802/m.150278 type:complete len:277 (+) Transcript_57802:2028-2858(+)